MSAVIVAQELEKSFGGVRAVDGLSLAVQAGEIYGLVGPDGAGKTTTLRLLAGVMGPSAGSARVGGADPLTGAAKVRATIGYMPQQYSLYGDLSVEENLDFFAQMFGLSRDEYRERRERLLSITRLERFVARRADALSGGMYKKLALACSMLPRPKALILDEPTNGVDPSSRRELWALLFELAASGVAILVSTAYMDEAARCHRVGLLDHGRLLLEGEPSALIDAFPHPAFVVRGGERAPVEALLEAHPQVLARSLATADIRVVVQRGAEADLGAELGALQAHLEGARPDFEDLFLATISARRAA